MKKKPRLGNEGLPTLFPSGDSRDSGDCLAPRKLVQYPHALPDGQPDPGPVPDRTIEYGAGFLEAIAGIEEAIDPGAVLGPLLYLVEIADVGVGDVFRLLFDRVGHGESIAHCL